MKAMIPMMMPTKQAKRDRIMRARVASKWAVDKVNMSHRWVSAGQQVNDVICESELFTLSIHSFTQINVLSTKCCFIDHVSMVNILPVTKNYTFKMYVKKVKASTLFIIVKLQPTQ